MATYIRLTDYKSSDEKEKEFFNPENRYEAKQEDFEKIPGSPIAYWVSDRVKEIFEKSEKLGEVAEPKQGLITGNNDRFLRYWQEISFQLINEKKWFPYNKGGQFRKWYGNNEFIVNWENNGEEIINFCDTNGKQKSRPQNLKYFFKEGITWTSLTSGNFNGRYSNKSIFDAKGPMLFLKNINNINYTIGLLNSNVSNMILKIIAPTMDYNQGPVGNIPFKLSDSVIKKQQIETITQQNIDISKEEWDSRETSWDFAQNELLRILNDEFLMLNEENNSKFKIQNLTLETVYNRYCEYWKEKFFILHSNEEELNRLFIEIYGLEDELTPEVDLKDITILKNEAKIIDNALVFDKKEIMKQFISYGVGVMFGRYSLDHKGLHVANMNESLEQANLKSNIQNSTFEADDDNIIPIVDESDYFSDDMTDRFTEFVRTTFGSEKLQQNIAFIEANLGKKIRAYFMKEFYTDHTKRYKKRPIYWLFSSPKGTFQTLIYMHRYTPDTLNNMLNDYLRPFRIRLDTMRNEALRVTESEDVSGRDKTQADKKIDKIDKTLTDINEYEKTLAHYAAQRIEIDLDDGVKVNYCKFKDLLFEFDKKLCK